MPWPPSKMRRAHEVISAKGAALTVLWRVKPDAALSPLGEEPHTDGNPSDDPHSETTASGKKSCLIRVTENITVAPRC